MRQKCRIVFKPINELDERYRICQISLSRSYQVFVPLPLALLPLSLMVSHSGQDSSALPLTLTRTKPLWCLLGWGWRPAETPGNLPVGIWLTVWSRPTIPSPQTSFHEPDRGRINQHCKEKKQVVVKLLRAEYHIIL